MEAEARAVSHAHIQEIAISLHNSHTHTHDACGGGPGPIEGGVTIDFEREQKGTHFLVVNFVRLHGGRMGES